MHGPWLDMRKRRSRVALARVGRLRVACTDPLDACDMPNLLRETGDVLEEQGQDQARLHFLIRKAG